MKELLLFISITLSILSLTATINYKDKKYSELKTIADNQKSEINRLTHQVNTCNVLYVRN